MSSNEKDVEKKTEETETKEKYVTKYDRKMQMRAEQKKKEEREKRISSIISTVVVIALICLVAYFPIRSYMVVHETYVKVNGENISKVEFDYNYNVVKNNYISQNGSYMSYFGLNLSQDLSTQMYSDVLSWKDYFEQMAVESITTDKALKAEAVANGFTYDTAKEYATYEENLKAAAQAAGVSVKNYVQQTYGEYATLGRIKGFVQDALFTNAYYNHVSDEKAPSDDEILNYYNENKADYDSVDYYLNTIYAELPTEPTELADPVDETEEAGADGEESVYQPSEAEVEKAMADAKVLADAALENVTTDGELQENKLRSDAVYSIRDWLFDDSRQEGDSTVIENTSSNCYYVVSFVKRYRDDTPSADVRIIATDDQDGQAILDEWKNGDATEESFAELADTYNGGTYYSAQGGLYEGVTPNAGQDQLLLWIFEEGRKTGDVAYIQTDDYSCVVYYVGTNKAKWQLNISDLLLSDTMDQYMEDIKAPISVEDTKGRLKYLQVSEEEPEDADFDTTEETIVETEAVEDTVDTEE